MYQRGLHLLLADLHRPRLRRDGLSVGGGLPADRDLVHRRPELLRRWHQSKRLGDLPRCRRREHDHRPLRPRKCLQPRRQHLRSACAAGRRRHQCSPGLLRRARVERRRGGPGQRRLQARQLGHPALLWRCVHAVPHRLHRRHRVLHRSRPGVPVQGPVLRRGAMRAGSRREAGLHRGQLHFRWIRLHGLRSVLRRDQLPTDGHRGAGMPGDPAAK